MRRYSHHHAELVRVLLGIGRRCRPFASCRPIASAARSRSTCRSVLLPAHPDRRCSSCCCRSRSADSARASRVSTYLFGQAGVAAPQAVALSILFVALGIVGNLPGSILYAFEPPAVDRLRAGPGRGTRVDSRGSSDERVVLRGCGAGALDAAALWSPVARALCTRSSTRIAVLPGVPLGIALFGRRHPAAWIGGALLGYGLTQLAIWAGDRRGAGVGWGVRPRLAGSAAALTLLIGAPRRHGQRFSHARVDGVPTARALLLVLVLVPVLMGPPYANLGRADAEGNRYYRAYFTADFLWHSALAFEARQVLAPASQPVPAPRAMNYYWTYFLLPATVASWRRPRLPALSTVAALPEDQRHPVGPADDGRAVPARRDRPYRARGPPRSRWRSRCSPPAPRGSTLSSIYLAPRRAARGAAAT